MQGALSLLLNRLRKKANLLALAVFEQKKGKKSNLDKTGTGVRISFSVNNNNNNSFTLSYSVSWFASSTIVATCNVFFPNV